MKKFRNLRADEIDVRVGTLSKKGCSLVLYKDARCDMNILDETVGPENWQRSHSRDNANCIVSIYDNEKQAWVSKEDVGKKSNSEPEKGLASDSFKRACTNWGIGRELYTSPFIWLSPDKFELRTVNGKDTTKDKFKVKEIKVTNGVITELVIINTGQYDDKDSIVFTYPLKQKLNEPKPKRLNAEQLNNLRAKLKEYNFVCNAEKTESNLCKCCKCNTIEEISYNGYCFLMSDMDKRISEVKAKINEIDRQDS